MFFCLFRGLLAVVSPCLCCWQLPFILLSNLKVIIVHYGEMRRFKLVAALLMLCELLDLFQTCCSYFHFLASASSMYLTGCLKLLGLNTAMLHTLKFRF